MLHAPEPLPLLAWSSFPFCQLFKRNNTTVQSVWIIDGHPCSPAALDTSFNSHSLSSALPPPPPPCQSPHVLVHVWMLLKDFLTFLSWKKRELILDIVAFQEHAGGRLSWMSFMRYIYFLLPAASQESPTDGWALKKLEITFNFDMLLV